MTDSKDLNLGIVSKGLNLYTTDLYTFIIFKWFKLRIYSVYFEHKAIKIASTNKQGTLPSILLTWSFTVISAPNCKYNLTQLILFFSTE